MTVEKFYARRDKLVDKPKADALLKAFKEKFLSADYDPKNQRRSRLLGCNLARETRWIPIEDVADVDVDDGKEVWFYDDREFIMFSVPFGEIRRMVASFEPWDEIDAVIFDDTFAWTVVLNHEDIIGLCGVGTKTGPQSRSEIEMRRKEST